MKKFFLLGFIFLLCGCKTIEEETVDNVMDSKYSLAKNSIVGYVKCIDLAYTEYQYDSLVGNYEVKDNSTLVNIDGVDVQLNVSAYGDEVKCGSIRIVGGSVKLDDCFVNGYSFSYDNQVIDK
jgi:hypothetical protein